MYLAGRRIVRHFSAGRTCDLDFAARLKIRGNRSRPNYTEMGFAAWTGVQIVARHGKLPQLELLRAEGKRVFSASHVLLQHARMSR